MLKIRKRELIVFVYLVIMFFINSFDSNLDTEISQVFFVTSVIFAIFQIIQNKYTKKAFMFLIIISLCSIVVFLKTGSTVQLLLVLSLIIVKDISIHSIFKCILFCEVTNFFLRITINVFSNTADAFYMSRMSGDEIVRYKLGYVHANRLALAIVSIVVLFLVIYNAKIKWIHWLIILFIIISMYIVTKGRTASINILLFVVMYIIANGKLPIKDILFKFLIPLPVLSGLFSILALKFYTNFPIFSIINRYLEGRLSNAWYYLGNANFTLFGHKLVYDNSNLIIDNGYILALNNQGIVFFLLFIVGFTFLLKTLYQNKAYIHMAFIAFFILYGITEGFILNPFINYSIFLLAWYYYKICEGKKMNSISIQEAI